MARSQPSGKPRIFYGYWIVAATFFSALIFSGTGFYGFGLFVTPLEADLGWARGEIMAALTVYFLTTGISAPLIGWLIDRVGTRQVMAAGALAAGTGFLLLSFVQELWQFYASYFVVGLGMAGFGIIPTTMVISNWFQKRRGTAIGLMSSGLGAGGLVLAPLIGGFLIPSFDWRITFQVLAVLVWAMIPVALLVIRTRPADMGLYPDGIEDPGTLADSTRPGARPAGLTPRQAIATGAFWLMALSFLTFGFSEVTILQHQVPYLEGTGFAAATAAGVLGVVGLWSTIGKFGFGWLCDRMPVRYVCAIGLGLQLVATAMLMNITASSPMAVVWLYASIMGLGVGSWLPAMSMLVSSNFGLASYGAIFGMIGFLQSFGGATGPLVAGYMYDAMATYHWVFIIVLSTYVIATASVLMVRRPAASKDILEGTEGLAD